MTAPARRSPRGVSRAAFLALVVGLLAAQLALAPPAAAQVGALSVDSPAARTEPDPGNTTTVVFTVTLERTAPGDVAVDYRTVDGTAVAGYDYIARSGSLFFPAGETTKTVAVTIRGDSLDEANETFTLELLNPFNATIGTASGTATITDNDDPPVMSISDVTVPEGNAGTTPAAFVVTLSEVSAQTVTVNYTAAAGTATATADFSPTTGTLTFPPGSLSRVVSVPVVGDTIDEADEQFQLNLSAGGNVAIDDSSGTATITDDDGPPTLSIADVTVTEPDDATFTVTLSTASGQDVTVEANTSNVPGPGGATSPGDFTETTQTLTIPAGQTTATFTVAVNPDNTVETDETFLVNLQTPTNAAIERGVATGTIKDDDAAQFAINDVQLPEGGAGILSVPTHFDFSVTRTGALPGAPVTLNYSVTGGTATATDFVLAGGSVTFADADSTKTARIDVTADAFREPTETFTVTLTQASGPPVTLRDAEGTGTIINDDGAPATVEVLDKTVQEGTGGSMTALFTVRVSADFGQPVGFAFATKDGTAKAGEDYAPTAGTQIIPLGGTNEATISVSIVTDARDEPNETFTVELSNVSNAELSDGSGLGTILDDDDAPVLNVAGRDIDEGDTRPVEITLSAPSGQTVTVAYAIEAGTATAGVDYAAPDGTTLTFAPGETRKAVRVTAVGDRLDEFDETLTVTLSAETNATVGTRTGTVTILDDDDPPALSIEASQAPEPADAGAEGEMVFAVNLDPVSGKDVTFDFATANGTAAAGSDYSAGSGSVRIPAGEGGSSITVTILGDDALEAEETLTLGVSAVVNATPPSGPATGTIQDNDGPAVLSITGTSVAEGDTGQSTAVLTVSRLGDNTATVTVDWETVDGTAVAADDDYTAADGTLSFAPGETTKTISVLIDGDVDDEADETFTVALTDSTPPDAIADAGATATVVILDDDGPTITVTGPAAPIAEGNGATAPAVFTVAVSDAPAQDVTVEYATVSGTATSPDDFSATSGTLTFGAGDATLEQEITVNVTGDTVRETDESFTLVLSNPVNASLEVSSATAVIDDDDRSVLAVADTSVVEGAAGVTTATFTVTLTPAAQEGFTVDYATAAGTATAPGDFVAASGKVFFAAGETVRTITVAVAGDTVEEPDETFTVKLSAISAPTVAEFGDDTATGTIVDDDRPPVVSVSSSGAVSDLVVTEGTGVDRDVRFQVRLSAARAFPVAVDYDAASGTAARTADFAAVSGRLTFAPGEQVKTVTVPVLGDSRYEATETFSLVLDDPARATVGPSNVFATILDDDRPGYILAATDGGIFTYGDAGFHGSTGDVRLNQPIVGVASHPSGRGYWLVASDGGIFTFGEAEFFGSTGDVRLNRPIVGMAATPSGQGYWLVASDGGIFTFGDAAFHGSTGDIALNRPVVGMAASPTGDGYWLVATDGGIFTFGDAEFHGSTGDIRLNRPVVGMVPTPTSDGYWLVADDGGIFTFGDAEFLGSAGAIRLNRPIVGMADL